MTERLIELRGIGKRYGVGEAAFNALTNVDLTIDQGEFVAIMGPSGSGKSTMMNIIGALDSPSSGQYLFKELHVETLTRDERALLRRPGFCGERGFVPSLARIVPRPAAGPVQPVSAAFVCTARD